jgi:CDP-2,3-bis-(O-geranylgeranyl)-sn-glycerol synthase
VEAACSQTELDFWFIVQALWLFLPAYMANMAPVFAMKLFPKWNTRIDGGKNWKDGKPILGPGKTWRGLLAGSLLGSLTATVQSFRPAGWDFSNFGATLYDGIHAPILIGFAMGFGALVGDSVKSFFKRRTGREGGAPWVPFDQLDFVVGALVFAYLASVGLSLVPPARANWWWLVFGPAPGWWRLLVLLVLTPGLHFVVNIIGYKLKMKKVPW